MLLGDGTCRNAIGEKEVEDGTCTLKAPAPARRFLRVNHDGSDASPSSIGGGTGVEQRMMLWRFFCSAPAQGVRAFPDVAIVVQVATPSYCGRSRTQCSAMFSGLLLGTVPVTLQSLDRPGQPF